MADYEYEREGYYASWKGDDNGTLAIGVGVKTTFSEAPDIKWGGLAQMSWASYDGKRKNASSSSSYQTGTFETEVFEYQLAAGPTCTLMEGISVYGGPFMHLIDGNHYHKHAGGSREYDIEERASFGGYVGTQIDIAENATFNIEYQRTGDAWAVAGGICWMLP
ncbi:MAG: outer membrane beta-barrel protein [Sedimentisphaerales bacterium]|nr:outer membrane beta-barrel protein [Sedimentisphaerales bacterium]